MFSQFTLTVAIRTDVKQSDTSHVATSLPVLTLGTRKLAIPIGGKNDTLKSTTKTSCSRRVTTMGARGES